MTPEAIAAVAALSMLVSGGVISAYRRQSALRCGDPYPQNVFRGLRWAAALRIAAVIISLLLLTVIGIADPDPLVDRLFSGVDAAGHDQVVNAFREVMAMACVGVASAAVLTDLAVTFVRASVARFVLISAFTIALVGSAAYGGLFIFALAVS